MSDKDFTYMDATVKEICRSLMEEPHQWVFDIYHFHKKGTSVHLWYGHGRSVTEIWTGQNTETVFSYEQGEAIYVAMKIARSAQASVSQNKVQKIFGFNEKDITPKPTPPSGRIGLEHEMPKSPENVVLKEHEEWPDGSNRKIFSSIKKFFSRIKFVK